MRLVIVARLAALCAVTALSLGACGPKPAFRLSADENNAYALREALVKRQLPPEPRPVNRSGQPRLFAVAAGTPKTVIAYDLAAGNVLWKVDADVQSRIQVGGDFVVALEGVRLVARDQARGAIRWTVDVPAGTFVGAAADTDRAYVVTRDGARWWLAAYDGATGARLWRNDAGGQLGAPAAHGGVVYAPFLNQWLSMIDGATGAQLTRVRGIDDQIAMLRVTSQVAYYGSKRGVYRLDERSASGRRTDATYGEVAIPAQLDRTSYGRDAYDPIHQTYSAADRARVLWSSEPSTAGPMKLTGDTYAIHYFRYVLGFDAAGKIAWAYNHPRVELVASEHTGVVITGLAQNGELVAIEPHTGAVVSRGNLGVAGPFVGATFDADGWSPQGQREPSATLPTLVQIVRDRDARFERVKELALSTLATTPGPEVTSELLAVLADARASLRLKELVVELLIARKDPASVPVLVEQLGTTTDHLANTRPEALVPVATTLAGLRGLALDPKTVVDALASLELHLDHGATATSDLPPVIAAMAAIGKGGERRALTSHLLLYHADDERGGDAGWQKAIVSAVLVNGGPAERATLRYVAADPRSKPGLVAQIHEALDEH